MTALTTGFVEVPTQRLDAWLGKVKSGSVVAALSAAQDGQRQRNTDPLVGQLAMQIVYPAHRMIRERHGDDQPDRPRRHALAAAVEAGAVLAHLVPEKAASFTAGLCKQLEAVLSGSDADHA